MQETFKGPKPNPHSAKNKQLNSEENHSFNRYKLFAIADYLQLLCLELPMLSEDTPIYLSLFFLAFFLSSRNRSSSWTNSTISFTFCRTLMPWSFPFSSSNTEKSYYRTEWSSVKMWLYTKGSVVKSLGRLQKEKKMLFVSFIV